MYWLFSVLFILKKERGYEKMLSPKQINVLKLAKRKGLINIYMVKGIFVTLHYSKEAIEHLCLSNYLEKDVDNFGFFKLTKAGAEILGDNNNDFKINTTTEKKEFIILDHLSQRVTKLENFKESFYHHLTRLEEELSKINKRLWDLEHK